MQLVWVALSLLLAAAGASPAKPLWDVAISRRPFIAEASGALLLRTDPVAGQGRTFRVEATLPCASRSWSWAVTPNATSTEHTLDLGSLASLPHRLNNDMLINVSVGGAPSGSVRRRFQRAFKASPSNTVQVDHSTAGLLVDGQPWAGWGWYVYPWTSFDQPNMPRVDGIRPHNICNNLTAHPELRGDCVRWGVGNMTLAMEEMARSGVNMLMPYNLNPHEHDGLPGLPIEELEVEALVLQYYNAAHRLGLKVLFHMSSMELDRGHYTNATLHQLTAGVKLVKDHPALLAYYICGVPTQLLWSIHTCFRERSDPIRVG